MTTLNVTEAAENFASTMKNAFANGTLEAIDELMDESITLHTPRHFKPVTNKNQVRAIIRALPQFIDGFHYDRHFINDQQVVMVFEGKVDDMPIQGIDLFTLNEQGKAYHVEVFVRPSKSLEALAVKEDAYIADVMAGKIRID